MTDNEEKLIKNLTESIRTLDATFKASSAFANMVTRCDLYASEARIVKALGERINPVALNKLTSELEKAAAPLEKAVADNQPG